jgi:hypothetical protein
MTATRKDAAQFAIELASAYSTSRYKGGWVGCIEMLRKRGYSDPQIEAIIRSKWTRWAADNSSDDEYATADDLVRFIDNPRNCCTLSEVNSMVEGKEGRLRKLVPMAG